MTTRRGFTMVELLMGLILTLMVGGVTYQLLNNSQRVSRAQMAQTSMQDNVRSGALVITNELREIGYDNIPAALGLIVSNPAPNPDLITILPGKIEYKATRGTGFTCAPPTPTQLKLRQSRYYGVHNPPLQNDSVAVYVEGNSSTASDDAWVHGSVTAVTTTGTCTDGTPAWVVHVAFPVAYTNMGTMLAAPFYVVGGPVRIMEVMEMKYYESGGDYWLGMRSVTSNGQTEPVIGPLSDSTQGPRGLTFEYTNATNGTAVLANDVRAVRVTLRGITDQAVRRPGSTQTVIDSLSLETRVALRNTLRP